jgi:hypothetical protein
MGEMLLVAMRTHRTFHSNPFHKTLYLPVVVQRAAAGEPPLEEKMEGDGKSRAATPRLTEERIRRLESIGFEWKVKHKMKRYYDKQ